MPARRLQWGQEDSCSSVEAKLLAGEMPHATTPEMGYQELPNWLLPASQTDFRSLEVSLGLPAVDTSDLNCFLV